MKSRDWLTAWRRVMVLSLMLLFAGASTAETVTYYYTNQQGTPLATADASGNILTTSDYRPYGSQVLGSPVGGPGYTGHVNDPDSGLVYMQARYYDPVVGRFLGVDQVGPSPENLSTFTRYAYAADNPVVNVDPNGRQTMPPSVYQIDWRDARTQAFVANSALNMVPGYAVAQCAASGCSAGGWALASVGVLPLAAPMREMAVVGELGGVASETKTLYRAVNAGELAQIETDGAFSMGAGAESKYFTTSSAAASKQAKILTNVSHDGPYTTVSTEVPVSTLQEIEKAGDYLPVDNGVDSYILKESHLQGLNPVVENSMDLPSQ